MSKTQLRQKEIVINPYRKATNETVNGFLVDFETTSIWEDDGTERSGINLYYYGDDGNAVKCFYPHDPYFFVDCEDSFKESEESFKLLEKRIRAAIPKHIAKIELVEVYDANHPEHRFLPKTSMVKLTLDSPRSVNSKEVSIREDILKVKGIIPPWREADITFDMRVSIDAHKLIKVGRHYRVFVRNGTAIKIKPDPVDRFPDLPSCSFDLETTKDPMKTPNPNTNPIGTIGVVFDEEGVIICNMEVIREVPGTFIMGTTEVGGKEVLHWEDVMIDESRFRDTHDNCMLIDPVVMDDEYSAILLFMELIVEKGSLVISGYNSDNFDWVYVAKRLEIHGDSIERFGFKKNTFFDAYNIPGIMCLDVFHYVQQHSRLPEGERSLKSATKKIFYFEPIEWENPEQLGNAMDPSSEDYDPISVAYYNGSDIYCTMLFLKKIVVPYFMSLSMDKPMNLFNLSRRGFSSLCEAGLLQRAHSQHILAPNKGSNKLERGTLVEIDEKNYYALSESYVGAVVELNQPGIYRSDWKMNIAVDPDGIDSILDVLEEAIYLELGDTKEQVVEMDRLLDDIRGDILKIKGAASFDEESGTWLYDGDLEIIHGDVASLYPSIIITYKIQPHAVVTEEDCSVCPYRENSPPCWCELDWVRVITVVDATEDNVEKAKSLYKRADEVSGAEREAYGIRSKDDFVAILKKVVKRDKKGKGSFRREFEIPMTARMCQKAHGFFWEEIRDVRDDRYKYKYRAADFFEMKRAEDKKLAAYMEKLAEKYETEGLSVRDKKGKIKTGILIGHITDEEYKEREEMVKRIQQYQIMATFNNFVQEGKKAGLNSYYGYLYTTGARWGSIECPGVITLKGRQILLGATDFTSCFSQLLEADTDGYYMLIPKAFPLEVGYTARDGEGKLKDGKLNVLSALLNLYCVKSSTNHNSYEKADGKWLHSPRCMLKFDTDGPFDTMFVSAKKKYSLWKGGKQEVLKGLETKRNNALELERVIINDIFDIYTSEDTGSLEEAYQKGEEYLRGVVQRLRKGEMPIERLTKRTNVSASCLTRLNNAMRVSRELQGHGIENFGYSFRDMQLIDIVIKHRTGEYSTYKTRALINSMGKTMSAPIFAIPLDILQAAREAYGGSEGINKGSQFMTAFRESDMGTEIDGYSSVVFFKSKYPSGKTYSMTSKGRLVSKEIRGGTSECMLPYSLLNTDVGNINRYIRRWTGNDPGLEKKEDVKDIIDFDYYVAYIRNLAERMIVIPAAAQGINIFMEDLFNEDVVRTISLDAYSTATKSRQKDTVTEDSSHSWQQDEAEDIVDRLGADLDEPGKKKKGPRKKDKGFDIMDFVS